MFSKGFWLTTLLLIECLYGSGIGLQLNNENWSGLAILEDGGMYVQVPVDASFYTPQAYANQFADGDYQVYKITQCDTSPEQIEVIINVPANPTYEQFQGFIIAQIGTSLTVWDSATVITVNYYIDNTFEPKGQISVLFNNSVDYSVFYIRVASVYQITAYNIQARYTKDQPTNILPFEDTLFTGTNGAVTDALQYVYASTPYTVAANSVLDLYAKFCAPETNDLYAYQIAAMATDTFQTTSLNMYVCDAVNYNAGECTVAHNQNKNDESTTVFTGVTMINQPPGLNLKDGVYIRIYGAGANNEFILSVKQTISTI